MTFLSKRTKFILIGLLLLFLIMGSWFVSTVYVSSRSVLERAENIRFTRATVSQLGEQGSMRHFFVTNRGVEDVDHAPGEQFGRTREPRLKFGFFDTKVEPSVGLGMFINPSAWFQNEEIQIKHIADLQEQAFIDQLRALVMNAPQRSLLVVVHGFKEAFPSALRKTAFIGHVLDINSPILVFDWPGNQGSSLRGYRRAQAVATESGAELARTLELIIREIQPEKLWLMANSMGGQVVADAFSILYQNQEFADAELEIEDVILTAPDVGQGAFDNQFRDEMTALTRDLTVYVSSNDRALITSRIVNWESRLGESGFDPNMMDETISIFKLMDEQSGRITLVDVTPVNRTRNFHNFSLETPEFFDDLFLRLTNKKTPFSRSLYRFQTPDGDDYWVLTPSR